MNSEESIQILNLKDSVNSMLQQQIKIILRCIGSCDKLTGKDLQDASIIDDLVESSRYICEIQKDCLSIQNQLKNLIYKVSPKLSLENSQKIINRIQSEQNSVIDTSISLAEQSHSSNLNKIKVKKYHDGKDVFGCLRYPFEYFNKGILGFTQPFHNVLLLKYVPKEMVSSFRKFKLEEYSKFEELSGLTVPNYFKSEEFFARGSSSKPYFLKKFEQKQIYELYHSKYFSSYQDIVTFFALTNTKGISQQICQYEEYLQQQRQFDLKRETI